MSNRAELEGLAHLGTSSGGFKGYGEGAGISAAAEQRCLAPGWYRNIRLWLVRYGMKIRGFDRQLTAVIRVHPAARLFMTAPGVGVITALSVASAFDEAERF